MNLVILHYHLNRGGVSSVIANHLRALQEAGVAIRVLILFGGRRTGWPESLAAELPDVDVSLGEVPELDYDEGGAPQPSQLAERLRSTLSSAGLAPDATIIHAHNHALGKNVSLPGALQELAKSGYRLLLQIHDFAEDFRPEVYRRLKQSLAPAASDSLPSMLYPQADQIHYAVLNGRDYRVLKSCGVNLERLHLLPNPVQGFPALPAREDAREKLRQAFSIPIDSRLLVYPVRCIRRKNIGEALLWSALGGKATRVGFTLAPMNVAEQPAYQRWQKLAASLNLPVAFELGGAGGLEFLEILAAANLILTTSVAEGFGMAFLECWLAGRALVGRDLPEITADFAAAGLQLDALCPELRVPLDWFDVDLLRERIYEAYNRVLFAYGQPRLDEASFRQATDQLADGGTIDFASLDSQYQSFVIERAGQNAAHREQLFELNGWIDTALHSAGSRELIEANAAVVSDQYALAPFGRKLYSLYSSLAAAPISQDVGQLSAGDQILHEFLEPKRFHPIRSET